MGWTERRRGADGSLVEWERADGWATLRRRRRADGTWVVRLDRLTQAPEGSLYREERTETRADADRVVAAWQATYDVAGESGSDDGGETATESESESETG
jgi:hypothetical protein